jgi:hypothetical protein
MAMLRPNQQRAIAEDAGVEANGILLKAVVRCTSWCLTTAFYEPIAVFWVKTIESARFLGRLPGSTYICTWSLCHLCIVTD